MLPQLLPRCGWLCAFQLGKGLQFTLGLSEATQFLVQHRKLVMRGGIFRIDCDGFLQMHQRLLIFALLRVNALQRKVRLLHGRIKFEGF